MTGYRPYSQSEYGMPTSFKRCSWYISFATIPQIIRLIMISHDKLDGSTSKSQVLHIVFPSQNKLDVHKVTLKSFDNQPLLQKRNWDEPACVAGDGFFPFFCFITLLKLRQQNVTCASRNILTCKNQPAGKIRKL